MRAIIFIQGGVAEVITDDPDARIQIIDYDVEPGDVETQDAHGDSARIHKEFEVNAEIVDQYWVD